MKLSVFYAHIVEASKQSRISIQDILAKVHDAGISAVEMDMFHFEDSVDHLSLVKNAGLKVACVNGFYALDKENPEEQITAHVAAAKNACCDKILIVPGFLTEEDSAQMKKVIHSKEETAAFLEHNSTALRIRKGLEKIAEYSWKNGITATIEDFDNPTSPISGINNLMWYLEKVPLLKCAFDTGNFITWGEDSLQAFEEFKNHIVHVHCKDRSEAPVFVGGGHLPIDQIVQKLHNLGYGGFLAIEHYGAEDQLNFILSSAKYLNNVIAKC